MHNATSNPVSRFLPCQARRSPLSHSSLPLHTWFCFIKMAVDPCWSAAGAPCRHQIRAG